MGPSRRRWQAFSGATTCLGKYSVHDSKGFTVLDALEHRLRVHQCMGSFRRHHHRPVAVCQLTARTGAYEILTANQRDPA